MADVSPHANPVATDTVDEVTEIDVLDVPDTGAQLAPVLAQAVN